MGGVWDRSASDRRHPSFQAGVQEAVIAWSAPQPWHREAEAFICRALSKLYPVTLARPLGWLGEFTYRNQRTEQIPAGLGQVQDRLAKDRPRLPKY